MGVGFYTFLVSWSGGERVLYGRETQLQRRRPFSGVDDGREEERNAAKSGSRKRREVNIDSWNVDPVRER